MNTRRALLLSPLLLALPAQAMDALAALEARSGGRLGVALLDTATGRMSGHRLDERFGLCSTFKLALAAWVLAAVDAGRIRPDLWVRYGEADLLSHAPVTRAHVSAGGMTAVALAEATQTTSDNPAANLLLRELGGPAAFTAWLRSQGDAHTRLDRLEPQMNEVRPGDPRDTTTPAAMARLLQRLLTGDALKRDSRERLIAWMEATQTGARRLRAGLPEGWRAGDKTGTSMHPELPDQHHDIAIVWPPGRAPWIVTAYYDGPRRGSRSMQAQDEAVLAEVGRILSSAATPPRRP